MSGGTLRQLPLSFPSPAARGREAFLISASNRTAFQALEGWREWPDRRLLLTGPKGAGKSHLCAIWVAAAKAVTISAAELDMDCAAQLRQARAIAVEDCQALADETALFHLLNSAAQQRAYILLTADAPAARWGVGLPDLASRLGAATAVALAPPDDALLRRLLEKRLDDHGVAADARALDYLVRRMERSFAAVAALVEALDALSLETRSRITTRLARRALALVGAVAGPPA